jgi:hypothetical protein
MTCLTLRTSWLHCAIFFLFGNASQHSVFSAEGPMNVSMTRHPLKCDRGLHCFHFSNTEDRWWQEEHAWAHVESTLHKLLFPQAVGEDMVNTCCRHSDFSSKYHAWNTVHGNKERFHSFHVTFICRRCLSSTARGIISLIPVTLNGIHPSANSFIQNSKCP